MSTNAETLLRRYEDGKTHQSNWLQRWHDAERFIMQHKGQMLAKTAPGAAETLHVFDSTARECAEIMASGLLTSTAPAGEQWFKLRPEASAAPGGIGEWLEGCSQKMVETIHGSNFYNDVFEGLVDLAAFSLCAVFLEEDESEEGNMVNFIQIPVGSFVIEEDARGAVDTLYRKFEFTARQAAEKWTREALSETMRKSLDSTDAAERSRRFDILHCMFPRPQSDVKPGVTTGEFRPYASVYVEINSRHVINEDGYYEKPFAVCRLMKGNNEIYGRGSSDKAMPTIKTLNQIERARLLGVNLMVNPPWLGPHDAAFSPDNRPGAKIYWDTSNANNKPERLRDEVRWDWVSQYAEERRNAVRSAFYVPMFQMLNNPDEAKRPKTAYEVSQMMQEKLVLFSPIFMRVIGELFNPILRRLFGIMYRRGDFGVEPDGLDVMKYQVDYVSKIALAVKGAQNSALMTAVEVIAGIGQFDQDAPMVIDWGKATRGVLKNLGLPVEWLRSEEELKEIMEQRQQAAAVAQLEQIAGAAEKGGAAAKSLGPEGQAAALAAMQQQ